MLIISLTSIKLNTFEIILSSRYMPRITDFDMFNQWAIYLQKIIPTIGYHYQILAGFEESMFAKIMGKISTKGIYTRILECGFLLIIIIIAVITYMKFHKSIDFTKVDKVYNVLLRMIENNDSEIDNIITRSDRSIIYNYTDN